MKKTLLTAGAVIATTSTAIAGGIERSSNDYGFLFQEGSQATGSVSIVNPTVSGEYSAGPAALGGETKTGNMSKSYVSASAAYKKDIGESLSFGIFLADGYGANAEYTQGLYSGLTADWDSSQVAFVLKYGVTDRISVYGGARFVQSAAEIAIPGAMFNASARSTLGELVAAGVPDTDPTRVAIQDIVDRSAANPELFNFTAEGERTGDWGYILGAAYEIPDIALRVALTYESAITHEFDTTEVIPGFGVLGVNSTTEVVMPQSVKLDFQTGIAQGTLLFGSVKWTEWSEWEVRTQAYEAITGNEITGFDNDTVTWRLGVGRQFNENASGFAQVRYEKGDGGVASRLAPTDGLLAFGIGGQLVHENLKIRGGMEYVKLGDAEVADGTKFEGNSAFGVGLSLTMSF